MSTDPVSSQQEPASPGAPPSAIDEYARPGAVHFAPTLSRGVWVRGEESALHQTLVMLLAGGQGERLYPLTRDRAKPAVPFGANYRVIDFALSNCINSGLRRVLVLTQYKSFSLQVHIKSAWDLFNPVLGEYVDVIPPQQRNVRRWYQGTADAIFQNIYLLEQERPRFVMILSSDHIYKMDYGKMLDFHLSCGADLTVSCAVIPVEEARRMGAAEIAADGRITRFVEKSPSPPTLPNNDALSYVSMGVYIFSTDVLVRRVIEDIKQNSEHDFGKNIVPQMVNRGDHVFAYLFSDESNQHQVYWRDIGTLHSYYEANMDLLNAVPKFNLHDDAWPIHRRHQPGPPAKTISHGTDRVGSASDSMLGTGVIVSGAQINHSILGPRCFIHSWAQVRDSILFDDVEIGRHCIIQRAIIDKHVKIPPHTHIGVNRESDHKRFTLTPEGIVVIPKNWKPK